MVDAQNLFLKLEKTEEVFEKEVELEIELQAKRLQFLEIPKTPKSKQNLTKKYTIIRLGFVWCVQALKNSNLKIFEPLFKQTSIEITRDTSCFITCSVKNSI